MGKSSKSSSRLSVPRGMFHGARARSPTQSPPFSSKVSVALLLEEVWNAKAEQAGRGHDRGPMYEWDHEGGRGEGKGREGKGRGACYQVQPRPGRFHASFRSVGVRFGDPQALRASVRAVVACCWR